MLRGKRGELGLLRLQPDGAVLCPFRGWMTLARIETGCESDGPFVSAWFGMETGPDWRFRSPPRPGTEPDLSPFGTDSA
jgi:hypothetical protein